MPELRLETVFFFFREVGLRRGQPSLGWLMLYWVSVADGFGHRTDKAARSSFTAVRGAEVCGG